RPSRPQSHSRGALEARHPRAEVLLAPPVIGEQLSRGVPSGPGIPRRADVVFPPRTSTRLPLVVPEVQVLVPVDPTHPQATADAYGNRLVLPLFRGRSQVPMNLPVGSANPSQGPRFRI